MARADQPDRPPQHRRAQLAPDHAGAVRHLRREFGQCADAESGRHHGGDGRQMLDLVAGREAQLVREQRLVGVLAHAGARWHGDVRQCRDVGPGQRRPAPRQGVVGAQQQHEGIARQRQVVEIGMRRVGRRQGEVDAARPHHLEGGGGQAVDQLELHARMVEREAREGARHHRCRQRRQRGQRHATGLQLGHGAHAAHRLVHLVTHEARLLGEHLAGGGELDRPRRAVEQARREYRLQARHRARDRRLRQVHPQRRAPEAQGLDQRQEDIEFLRAPIDLHG